MQAINIIKWHLTFEVISWKDQKQYWAQNDKQYRFVPASEFAEAFQSFHVGERIKKEITIPFDKTKRHPLSLATSKYGVKRMELLKACIVRELLLLKKNSFVYAFRALKVTIVAIITMTVFFRTNMPRKSVDDGTIFLGSIFFSIMNLMLNGLSEVALTIVTLSIFYKQRDSLFYPSWAYAISAWILKIPLSFVEVSSWVFLTYYVIGYDPSILRFLKHYILIFLVTQWASGLYRSVTVIARTMVLAIATTIYISSTFLIFSGYMLSHDNIRKYLIWGYWISPIMYSQNAASINEFLGNNWNHIIPGTNQTLGVQVLKNHGIFVEENWYWIGVAVLAGYALLSNLLFTTSLCCTKSLGRIKTMQAEELMDKKQLNTINDFQATPMEDFGSNRELGSLDGLNSTKLDKRNITTLPFTPISISFDNVMYSVDMPKALKTKGTGEKLVLLNGLSGCFREGVLTALMGVSGAGKTTLLDVLAGRKTSGYIEGNITISGYPKDQQTFARLSGYCEQNDIHSPYVTVYESLVYSAWLRLSANIDSEKKAMFIEEVIDLVEIMDFRDALVGLPGINGLSIDQRKRLTIAVELVANPSIIFMDEPTSGVDARTSAIVMRVVRKIVNTGRTVVCTIHQPSIDIFETFDELFLMKKGQEIYVGPLGKNSCDLIAYFEEIHGISKIKDGYNPASWILEVTSETQENLMGVNFNEIYKSSDLYLKNAAIIAEQSIPHSGSSKIYFSTKYSQTFSVQFVACLWKFYLSYSRNSAYTTLKFFLTILVALTYGIVFWDLGRRKEKQRDLFNAMGSIFVTILFLGVACTNLVQPIVSIERTVSYRERAAGMYSALPYAIGQVVIELPYIFVQAVIYCVIVYSMIGFDWTATKFFWYLFFTYFSLLQFTYYGMMTVSTTPNLHIANILATSFFGLWVLFGGLMIPRLRMPIWWRWFCWVCPVSWSMYGMLVSQYGDYNNFIDSKQTVANFLKSFGYNHDFLGVVALSVVLFAVLFASLFVISIKYLNFLRR